MKNLLFIAAGGLITIWAIRFFGNNTGMIVHLLLVLAAVSVIVGVTSENKTD